MPDIGGFKEFYFLVSFNNEHIKILFEKYRNLISSHFSAAGCVGWSAVSQEIANILYAIYLNCIKSIKRVIL